MEPLIISDDLWLVENAIFLPKTKTLAVSDLQIGYEQQLRDRGANILYEQANQMLGLFEALIRQTGAKRLVIDGDLKHEFGRTTFSERRDVRRILALLKKTLDIVVVLGNHDRATKPLTDELGIPSCDFLAEDGFFIIHGHELPDERDAGFRSAHTIVIGHMHPAVRIDDGVRNERFKCFLVGKYKRKRLVVLPSFSTIVEGSDILKVASNSPFISGSSSMVYVLADEIRPFGRISDLKRILG